MAKNKTTCFLFIILFFCWSNLFLYAGEFAGLKPGFSTIENCYEILGNARRNNNEFVFDGSKFDASLIRVVIDEKSRIIQSIKIYPKTNILFEDLCVWLKLGNPDFVEAVNSSPDKTMDSTERMFFFLKGMMIESQNSKVVLISHDNPKLLINKLLDMAIKYIDSSDNLTDAINILKTLYSYTPSNEQVCITLGKAYFIEGNIMDANYYIKAGLKLNSENEQGRFLNELIEGELQVNFSAWIGVHLKGNIVSKVFDNSPAYNIFEENDAIQTGLNNAISAYENNFNFFSVLRLGKEIKINVNRSGNNKILTITPIDGLKYFEKRELPSDDYDAGIELFEKKLMGLAEKRLRSAYQNNSDILILYDLAQASERINFEKGLEDWTSVLNHPSFKIIPEPLQQNAQNKVLMLEKVYSAFEAIKKANDTGKYNDASLIEAMNDNSFIESSNYYFERGYAFKNMDKMEKAAKEFFKAAYYWSQEPLCRFHLAECSEYYNLKQAYGAGRKYINIDYGNPKHQALLNSIYKLTQKIEVALNLKSMGDIKAEQKDYSAACKYYIKAWEIIPNSEELLWKQIDMLTLLKKEEQALELARKLVKMPETSYTESAKKFIEKLEAGNQ